MWPKHRLQATRLKPRVPEPERWADGFSLAILGDLATLVGITQRDAIKLDAVWHYGRSEIPFNTAPVIRSRFGQSFFTFVNSLLLALARMNLPRWRSVLVV
jgi:hypothetical protein